MSPLDEGYAELVEFDAETVKRHNAECRARMRFEAATAAMQGLLAAHESRRYDPAKCAGPAVEAADALLAELDRTAGGGS